jgi:hypothetical protein
LRVVLQRLVELLLLVPELGHLSFEVFDVLSRAPSDNPLCFSVVGPFPLKLSFRESIDTSRPYSGVRRPLGCRQAAGRLFLGLAPSILSCRGFGLLIARASHHA